ncbi:MAG TPA: PAS domain-containing protein [Phenylobacterium sp.]
MKELFPLTRQILDALAAQVVVLDRDGTILAANKRWRLNRERSDCVGANYLELCFPECDQDKRAARVRQRLTRVLTGDLPRFSLACRLDGRAVKMRATRVSEDPVRVLVAHEDITSLLDTGLKLQAARAGLSEASRKRAATIGQAYEELGQRLAAIGLATHAIERTGHAPAAVNTIRIALDEARVELQMLRYLAEQEEPAGVT